MPRVLSRTDQTAVSPSQSRALFITAAVLLFLLLGAALFIVYHDTVVVREQINSDFNRQQLVLARQLAVAVSSNLHDIESEVVRIGWIVEHTRNQSTMDTVIGQALVHYRSHGVAALVIDSSGNVDCRAGADDHIHLETFEIRRDSLGQRAMEGRLCLPLTTASGKTAVLNATINATAVLADVIADVRPGRTGYTWAVDRDGLLLFHPDRELVGQDAFAGFDNESSGASYAGISRITEAQVTSGEPGTGTYVSGWHGAEEMEVPKLVAFAPVTGPILPPDRPWIIAVATPVTEVAESVHDIESRHVAAEAAIIGGMFLFGLLVLAYQRRRSQTLREEVTEKEKVLASILRSSVDAIIFIDNQNRVQVWNKGAELVFGYTAEEMIGQSFHRLIPPEIDADEELNRIAEEVRRIGFIRNYRAQRITRAGKRITVDISRTVIIGEDGSPLGSTAIIKDITEKEEMDKLIYSTEKLASIGTLAAGVAHEINNPLGVILGFTDLLRERFPKGSPEYRDLVIIEENANNAKRIVEDMLGFARVSEGLEDSVDIGHCIDRVLSIAQVTLKQDDIRIVADVAENLPDVQGDAREFQQVAFNLISNAMDAMAGTGGTLTVRAWHDNDRVYFSVSDTGIGIPDRLKGQIFDPFFTTKKVGKGTGLGLSLCYGIVKKHGGTIEFTSTSKQDHPDQTSGTTFTVSMPVVGSQTGKEGEN